MATTEFYLFRHGETDWNNIGRMQGSADIALNSRGIEQAEAMRVFFDQLRGDPRLATPESSLKSLISSPLSRARETARIALRLSEVEGRSIRTDQRWAETHLGQAEGLRREEVIEKFGENHWLAWIGLTELSWDARFPGGESKGEVRDRALQALSDFSREAQSVWIIATHGGLLRRVLHHFHPQEQQPIDVVNGAVFRIILENGIWHAAKSPVFTPD